MNCIKAEDKKTSLLQVWEASFGAYRKEHEEGRAKSFALFRRMVLHKFTMDSVHYARLNDETVYVKLLELMGVYKKIVLEGRIESGISPEAKTLLDGICEVLVSRLSQFFAKFPSGLGSPVRAEKIQIIEESVIVLAEQIGELADATTNEVICHVGQRQASTANNESGIMGMAIPVSFDINIDFPAEIVENVYGMYTDALLGCLMKLDDLHSRKIAGFFMDLLEREWEELGNIIKVQVGALEEHSLSPIEDSPVSKVLGMLREVYQHLGPVIEEYKNLFASARLHPEGFILKDDFYVLAQQLQFSLGFDGREFIKLLHEEVKHQLGKLLAEFAKATYKIKRLLSGDVLLAAEIAKTFGQLLMRLPDSDDESTGAILRGIRETTEIKISSLKESMTDFEEQGDKHIKELGIIGQSLEIPDELIGKITDSVKASWLASMPDDAEKFLESCLNGDEFLPAREYIDKIIDAQLEKVEKTLLSFKKEILLYEICTFEEILTHSVPKLESSVCEATLQAAALLRDVFKELEVILKKNNISVIRPGIRSEFNTREHEVLVAEKNDDFSKGDIIKVLTAGYMYKDSVILRANVIAAR